jgi:hypothetical protein
MNFGFDTGWLDLQKWIGKYIIRIHFPNLKIGLILNSIENEKFFGIRLQINNEIFIEKYDYGFVACFVILGFGISVNKVYI